MIRRNRHLAVAVTLSAAAALIVTPPAGAQLVPDTGSVQVSAGHVVAGALGAGVPADWLRTAGAPLPSPGPGVTVVDGPTWGAPRPRVDAPGLLGPGREPDHPPVFVGSRSHRWESWARVDDDTISVRYTGAVPACEGAAVRVVESGTAVTVDLRTGQTPENVGRPCILFAVPYAVTIDLRHPLGDRVVLDAAG